MAHGENAKKNGGGKDLWSKRPNKFKIPVHSKFAKKNTIRMERRINKKEINDA